MPKPNRCDAYIKEKYNFRFKITIHTPLIAISLSALHRSFKDSFGFLRKNMLSFSASHEQDDEEEDEELKPQNAHLRIHLELICCCCCFFFRIALPLPARCT